MCAPSVEEFPVIAVEVEVDKPPVFPVTSKEVPEVSVMFPVFPVILFSESVL